MQQSLQVTFHNLPSSEALEGDVRARVAKLETLYGRVVGGRVVIDSPHRNQVKGKTYAIRIELALPGHELVVSREAEGDVHRVLDTAFDTARRQLKEHAERHRRHAGQPPELP